MGATTSDIGQPQGVASERRSRTSASSRSPRQSLRRCWPYATSLGSSGRRRKNKLDSGQAAAPRRIYCSYVNEKTGSLSQHRCDPWRHPDPRRVQVRLADASGDAVAVADPKSQHRTATGCLDPERGLQQRSAPIRACRKRSLIGSTGQEECWSCPSASTSGLL